MLAALVIDLPGPPDLDDLSQAEKFAAIQRLGRAGWRSPKSAAAWLGLPKSEVYGLLEGGQIWAWKRGKRWMVPVVELRRYMANEYMLRECE